MRIVDENGNDIDNPDLMNGYLLKTKIAKKDAVPPDDETKFVYEEDDYELVQMYFRYAEGELENLERAKRDAEVHSQMNDAILMLVRTRSNTFTNTEALSISLLFEEWTPYTDSESKRPYHYLKDDIRRYNEDLYRCNQDHDSQESWTPDTAHSLWTRIVPPGEIPEWEQPVPGVFDGYEFGQRVTHIGKTWESTYKDGFNVWEPGAIGTETLWKEVV